MSLSVDESDENRKAGQGDGLVLPFYNLERAWATGPRLSSHCKHLQGYRELVCNKKVVVHVQARLTGLTVVMQSSTIWTTNI